MGTYGCWSSVDGRKINTRFPLRTTPLFHQYVGEYSSSIQSTKIQHKCHHVLYQIYLLQPLYHFHLYSSSAKPHFVFKSRFHLLLLFLHNLNPNTMGRLPDQDSTFFEYKIPMGKHASTRLLVFIRMITASVTRLFNWKVISTFKYLYNTLPSFSIILENTEKKKPPYPKRLLQSSTQISMVMLTFSSHPVKVQKGTNSKRQREYGPLSQS